jgi:phosphoglycerol transferase MdoB-like AlkP superfamily enzyme
MWKYFKSLLKKQFDVLALGDIFIIGLIGLLLFMFIRIFEYIGLLVYGIPNIHLTNVLITGILLDISYWFILSGFLIIVYFAVKIFNKKLAIIACQVLLAFSAIIYFIAILYYRATSLPLDSVVFTYSFSEIWQTLGVSSGMKIGNFAILLFILVLPFVLWMLFKKVAYKPWIPFFFGILSVLSILLWPIVKPSKFESENENINILRSNKLFYLIDKSIEYFQNDENSSFSLEKEHDIKIFQKLFPNREYCNTDYPLLRNDSVPNVLGPYFKSQEKKPNIVIIVVESLWSVMSGPKADPMSFTPFLDSIGQQGLYFDNFLSTAEKTFGALPSILGSLPFGKQGFLKNEGKFPNHLSLFTILNENEYRTNFFYGGNSDFDNMKRFLRQENITNIYDIENLQKNGETKKSKNFSWGLADGDVFTKYFQCIKKNDTQNRADLFLTLSMHDPYSFPEIESYRKLCKKRIRGLHPDIQAKILSRIDLYASFLYFDASFRRFLEKFKKQPEYKNTIFIITGDHGLSDMNITENIQKYHVPLVIYSPLLTKKAIIHSVSTHYDIAPTLLALLNGNYRIILPKRNHWIGDGLDTCVQFRSTKRQIFMRHNRQTYEYLHDTLFLVKNTLFIIKNGFSMQKLENPLMVKTLSEYRRAYVNISRFTKEENLILPRNLELTLHDYSTIFHNDISYTRIVPNAEKSWIDKLLGKNKFRIDSMGVFCQNREYSPIYADFALSPGYKQLYAEITLDIQPYKTKLKDLPQLIMTVGDNNNKLLSWQAFPLSSITDAIQPDEWNRLKFEQVIELAKLNIRPESRIQFYLDNIHKANYQINNIQTKFSIETKILKEVVLDFDSTKYSKPPSNISNHVEASANRNRCDFLQPGREFTNVFLEKVIPSNCKELFIRFYTDVMPLLDVFTKSPTFVLLIGNSQKKLIYWNGVNLKDYLHTSNHWQQISFTTSIDLKRINIDNKSTFQCYLYNPHKFSMYYDNVHVVLSTTKN